MPLWTLPGPARSRLRVSTPLVSLGRTAIVSILTFSFPSREEVGLMIPEAFTVAGEMAWYVPILIYLARICDVSMGTVRTILTVGGHPFISASLGFVEVTIWVLAIGGVMAFLPNPLALLGYAAGFATGVLVGMFIERRLALGYRVVRAISRSDTVQLSENLRERGYRVTTVDGRGRDGAVELAYLILRRRDLAELHADIARIDPMAIVSVSQADEPTAGALGRELPMGKVAWLKGTALRK